MLARGGGGAILKNNGIVIAYWWAIWDTASVAHLEVRTGIPDHQTFWEALALLISMVTWKKHFATGPVLIIGDNIPALQNTLDLKGRGALMAISREIAWRQARFRWRFDVGHLPSEFNKAPDALSRFAAPSPEPWPYEALEGATESTIPDIKSIWKC